ncbi:LacI family transcriptional regulator [Photobacterium rosenbergii]|uniref:Autoinducer 2-binding periplasmic protein LuxP n=1 Tax=Photobacterium rosenbergii TaxID=294936 RepID=A0A2T3N9Q9_9GAMM|nr:LacI family DNA-binding transcriptional regulator [Photobacterium rosenbergii]PSW10253.1 LacI family transcriptional regulator [Photobacterium rosenbergii]
MAKTVDEIAKLAGVSVTTVRLVINGQDEKYRISEKTRNKVKDIIHEHGYVLNQTARNLKLKKTQTLGLVVPSLTNPFFSALVEELERKSRDLGYQLITACTSDDEKLEEQVVQNFLSRDVDGLFVTPCSAERQKVLANKKTPIVFLDRDFYTSEHPVVATDNDEGGRLLATELSKLASELYILGSDSYLPTVQARIRGFKSVFPIDDEAILIEGKTERATGYRLMESLYNQHGGAPSGLVTISLPILEGAMEFLRKHYQKIPNDIIVGSFDDHSMLGLLHNPVVAVQQDIPALSSQALEVMQTLIKGGKVEQRQYLLPPKLVVRT